jgi:hypothetical protein
MCDNKKQILYVELYAYVRKCQNYDPAQQSNIFTITYFNISGLSRIYACYVQPKHHSFNRMSITASRSPYRGNIIIIRTIIVSDLCKWFTFLYTVVWPFKYFSCVICRWYKCNSKWIKVYTTGKEIQYGV